MDELNKPRLSRATAQSNSRASGDPLAELARLIGRDEVFQQMRNDAQTKPAASGRAPWLARRDPRDRDARGDVAHEPQPQPVEPVRIEPSPRVAQPLERRPMPFPMSGMSRGPAALVARPEPVAPQPLHDEYEHDERGHEAVGTQHAPAYDSVGAQHGGYDTAHDGYEEPTYYDDNETYAEELPPRRRRTALWAVAAVLGIAVIGTAGAVGFRSMGSSKSDSQVPVIKADTAPAKLVPPPPARDPQPRTASLDRGAERLVSNEEQPVDLDARLAAARANASTLTTGAIGPSPSVMALASTSSSVPTSESSLGPKKVRTISIRPDGSTAGDTAMRASGDTGARAPTRSMASQPPVPPAPVPTSDPARATRSASLGSGAAAPTVPSLPASGPMVQLASQKTETDAQSAYRALQAKYPNILSGRQATIKRVEIADKGTFYRAQVGPFASSDQASDFCNGLKAVGGQCIVQRN